MFSTCMSVVDSCSEVAKNLEFKKRGGSYKYSALCAALADLCHLARRKVRRHFSILLFIVKNSHNMKIRGRIAHFS